MKRLFSLSILGLFLMSTSAQDLAPEATNATPGTMTIKFTTKASSNPGKSPRNLYAVWLSNSAGTYIRTLGQAGSQNGSYQYTLVKWIAACGGSLSAINYTNATNGQTGATKTSHAARTITWDGTLADKTTRAADGTYQITIEANDRNNTSLATAYYQTLTITKGTSAIATTSVATTSQASGMLSAISYAWAPASTVGFPEVKAENDYSIYPNPTLAITTVKGEGIKGIEILTLSGSSIFYTNEPVLNLSALPKGIYLAKISTDKGTITKRVQKL